MPDTSFHRALMTEPTGIPPYQVIPALATWKGDIVKVLNRLPRARQNHLRRARQDRLKAIAQRAFNVPGQSSDAAAMQRQRMRLLAAGLQQQEQAQPQQQQGRIAGDLTNSNVVDAALERYHAGALNAGPPHNQLSKSILGSLLVDIYTVTGQFMRTISRNPQVRTDRDCALFPLYRALHFAAADVFGQVFGINGDQIDVYLRQQLIFMSTHGAGVDTNVGRRMHRDADGNKTSRLAYLSDEEALACQLHIDGGRLMITNGQGALEPFDCSGPEYQDISRTKGRKPTKTANPARRGTEKNGGLGVAGFSMGLNRNIYARKHSNYAAAKGSFYHSCYLEGREVLCTGCITVVDGQLKYINNWSGHYQPSRQQLSLAVQALRAQGIDISNVTVEYQQTDGTYEAKLGPAFLESDGVKGADFDGFSKGRFVATARKVREALMAYEQRSKKWWAKPSLNSRTVLEHLQKIEFRDDEKLVREVRFLLGEKFEGRGYQPMGQTNDSICYEGMLEPGELAKKLNAAMAGLERY